jgi:hypothetical protein
MNSTLPIASILYRGDGKPHPVEGVVLLALLVVCLVCFDKWIVKKDSKIQRKMRLRQSVLDKAPLSKRLWFSVLQLIDFFVGLIFVRGTILNDKPYRKATEAERRVGGCCMALLPLFFALAISHTGNIDAILDSMLKGQGGVLWLYLVFIVCVGGVVIFMLKIAPQIALRFSIPVAVVSWPLLFWVVRKHGLI